MPQALDFGGTSKPRSLGLAAPTKLNLSPTRPMNFNAPTGLGTGGGGGVPKVVITPPGQDAGGGGKKKPRSLWNQVTDIVGGIVPGVIELGKTAVESSPIGMAVRAGYRAAEGKDVNFNPFSAEWNPLADQVGHSFIHTAGDIIHPSRFLKAVRQGTILDKLLEDAGNVALVAGPVAKGLGMAAGAAEAGGYTGLARAAGAAETGARFVHTASGKVGDLPNALPRTLLNVADKTTVRTLASLAAGEGPLAETAAGLRNRMPLLLTDQGRSLKAGLTDVYGGEARANARVRRELLYNGGLMEKDAALRPTLHEQGAATALLSGVGGADHQLRQAFPTLTPEQVRQGHVLRSMPEQTYTPEVADIVRQYQEGTLDPKSLARIERYKGAVSDIQHKVTQRGLLGAGRFRGPIDPRWLGSEAIDEYVTSGLEQTDVPQPVIDDITTRRSAGEEWTSIEQDHPELTPVLDNPQSWPKAWRPAMRSIALGNKNLAEASARAAGVTGPVAEGNVRLFRGEKPVKTSGWGAEIDQTNPTQGRWFTPDQSAAEAYTRGRGKLRYVDVPQDVFDRIKGLSDQPPEIQNNAWAADMADEVILPDEYVPHISDHVDQPQPARPLPLRPPEMLAAGMEKPTYFSSAKSELPMKTRFLPGGERTNLGATGFKGLSSEKRSLSGERLPYSARTMGEALGREAGRMEFNKRMATTLSETAIPSVSELLGDQATRDIIDQAKQEGKAQRFTKFQIRELVGNRLQDALKEAGHSPVIGDLNAPKPGEFDFGAPVNAEDIRADTPVVETAVKEHLTQRWANKGGGALGGALDWTNKKFKSNVLPFSVRWQLGDLVGGGAMAWGGGGVNPAELGSKIRQLKHLDPYASEQLFEHPDFADASLTAGEHQMFNDAPDAPGPRTPIGKYKRGSFKFNAKINELNRHGYLLAKTDELLSKHGLSVNKLGGDETAWARPEVQQAVQNAVDDAMKVMGDFNEMSPFEQRYMKRVFPFYAWTRHITSLVAHMGLDNPARLMWTMRLGSYGSDPNSDLPSYLKGGIPLPGGMSLSTSSINPFADVIGGEPIYTPAGALRSMAPAFALTAAGTLGADLKHGGKQFTRPNGETGPLRPLEMLNQVANILPVSRVARDLLPLKTIHGGGLGTVTVGPATARYGSGAGIRKYGTTSRIPKAFPLLGLPITTTRKGG